MPGNQRFLFNKDVQSFYSIKMFNYFTSLENIMALAFVSRDRKGDWRVEERTTTNKRRN